MSLNNNALFFSNKTQQDLVDKQKQELYMQLYPFIAEDFLSSLDAKTYGENIDLHIQNIQIQLDKLFNLISTHTHPILPHIHIAPSGGGPTTPTSLVTELCFTSSNIVWMKTATPTPQNTTGSLWNIAGNFIIEGVPSDGMVTLGYRRAKPLILTEAMVLSPIMKATMGLPTS